MEAGSHSTISRQETVLKVQRMKVLIVLSLLGVTYKEDTAVFKLRIHFGSKDK